MSTNPPAISATAGLIKQASTGPGGFALQNGTPTILSWTAPNDGQVHRYLTFGNTIISSAETGGAIATQYTPPGGASHEGSNDAGGNSAGTVGWQVLDGVVQAGTTVSLLQISALTVGAAKVVAEIWGA